MNVAKIHAAVHQKRNVVLITMWPHVNAYQVILVMHTTDANAFKSKNGHNVLLTLIVQVKWRASIICVRTHVLKRDHADRMPFARWSIHCHCVQWCVLVSQALWVMRILAVSQVK